jgi:hypothetical protein
MRFAQIDHFKNDKVFDSKDEKKKSPEKEQKKAQA